MKALKEVNKSYKPVDISEHMQIVSNDIQKIFGNKEILENNNQNLIPTEYNLSQNYPNPFNPVTKISFDLPNDSKVKLIIYDLLGREIARLVNDEFKIAGRYTVDFNGSNISSGIYFYRIETDNYVQTKKMVLIK